MNYVSQQVSVNTVSDRAEPKDQKLPSLKIYSHNLNSKYSAHLQNDRITKNCLLYSVIEPNNLVNARTILY